MQMVPPLQNTATGLEKPNITERDGDSAEIDKEGIEIVNYTRGDGVFSLDRENKTCYYRYGGHGST